MQLQSSGCRNIVINGVGTFVNPLFLFNLKGWSSPSRRNSPLL